MSFRSITLLFTDSGTWSSEQFKHCHLGDKRRTNRLISLGKLLCQKIGDSISSCCEGNSAELEGNYRFIRNNNFSASDIAQGIFKATRNKCENRNVLLALEDTTSLSYKHSVRTELGYLKGGSKTYAKGFFAHSVLMVDGEEGETLGLIGQLRWKRDESDYGKHHQRKERPYIEKESYKWEESSRLVQRRMGSLMRKVISVCDRESDIYEYLNYKVKSDQRFVIRAVQNRRLQDSDFSNLLTAASSATKLGEYNVDILQKSGRKARTANISLLSSKVTLSPPAHCKNTQLTPVDVNVVIAKENTHPVDGDTAPLSWILLTTEPAETFEQAIKVIEYYKKRWRIEEFHKAWKSGAGAERQRMQSAEVIEKVSVILATIAVRLLQMKEAMEKEAQDSRYIFDVTLCLSADELLVLKMTMAEKSKGELPKNINARWVYQSIAKLGGWADTKRTGTASWDALWKGWYKLQERVEGYLLAKKYTEI